MLAEKELTFDKALEIALAVETAERDDKQLQKLSGIVMYQSQGRAQHQSRQEQVNHKASSCYQCLGNHALRTCQYKEAECHKCHKKGHVARACRTRAEKQGTGPGRKTKKAHYLDEVYELDE